MSDYFEQLMVDPRPDLADTHLWTRLFRLAIILPDGALAEMLLKRFWTMRSVGTIIRRTHIDTKFEPLLEPFGGWPSMEFFLEMRMKYLAPHKEAIMHLMEKLKSVEG